MITSAVSLWKKIEINNPLCIDEWGQNEDKKAGMFFSHLNYNGRKVDDGDVRIYAEFGKPIEKGKYPAILLLPDAGVDLDTELLYYFIDKGYAVLMPDYCGKPKNVEDSDNNERKKYTVYPPSLSHANYTVAKGLDGIEEIIDEINKAKEKNKKNKDMPWSDKEPVSMTCWYDWIHVALYSIEYLKQRGDITNIGVIGIRTGGEIAWKTMLSPDVACGIPINSAGWRSYRNVSKFADNAEINMSDERHIYIAGIDSQSYAPFVKCPVLMLCSLHDPCFDYDRAYDTYARIGGNQEKAICYSKDSGSCIGPKAISDMYLFLEKHLKGREVFVPGPLNIVIKTDGNNMSADVEFDEDGLIEEVGVFYAETKDKTPSFFREWQSGYKISGTMIKNGKVSCSFPYYKGASRVFAYAYAKYINGFYVMSKITMKKLDDKECNNINEHMLFSGGNADNFSVAYHETYSVAGIFLESEVVPKMVKGYGDIYGVYSVGGIKTYKILSPRFHPDVNSVLEFDVYSPVDSTIIVSLEVIENNVDEKIKYSTYVDVKGGGKWKRVILEANDFSNEKTGSPLRSYADGVSIMFDCEDEDNEYAITNILIL